MGQPLVARTSANQEWGHENNRLRKLVADLSLDKEALLPVIRKAAGARSAEGRYRQTR
jgi:hypothetical protein